MTKREWRMIKEKREDDDRRGKGLGSKGEMKGLCFGEGKGEITRVKRRNQRTKKRKERKQLEEGSDRKEKERKVDVVS